MKERSRPILLAGVIAGLVLAGTVSATTGGRTARPAARAVDKVLYQQVKTCLESAIKLENLAVRTKNRRLRRQNILRAISRLICAHRALGPRRGEIQNGTKIRDRIAQAIAWDRRALDTPNQKLKKAYLVEAGNDKKVAYTQLTGNAPPPEVDLGCEAATDNAGDEDEFGMRCIAGPQGGSAQGPAGPGRSAAAEVNEVELSARAPITRFSDWSVVGNNLFRTGPCTRLAESLINCRIDPPMPVGGVFVVRLAGLPTGTSVVMEVVSGNRAQHGTVTTK